MLRTIYFILLPFALLGDARVFFFVANHLVFGSHKEEKSPFTFLLYTVPPLLLFFTLLFWPLHRWIVWLTDTRFVSRITPDRVENVLGSALLAKLGASWLFIAAGIGAYWIVDRIRVNYLGKEYVPGTRTLPSLDVKLRKAHIPFRLLRRLGAHNDLYDIEVTRHEVFLETLPPELDGYRIAFLTDTHVASFVRRDFYRAIHEQVRAFDPDLILLGGDFITFERHIDLMASVIAGELQARDGVYAILGNHDYWAGGEKVVAAMSAKGVRFLINKSVDIRGMTLAGIDEVYRGKPDLDAAFAHADPKRPILAVSHHPDIIDLVDADGRRVDLLVCGHTHGGQIRLPFFGPIVVPSHHEGRYASGFHRVGRVLLYVSRGIGAIPPVRILCRPEIATFTLRRRSNDHETERSLADARAARPS
jgi:predicted MPP superfamily phosphohydrolase